MDQLESDILASAIDALERHKELLAARGILAGAPEIVVAQSHPRSSEFRIIFTRDGNVSDVLEFEIYRRGQALVGLAQVTEWLEEEMGSVS